MTLDQAVDRLGRENLRLRALALEVPQAGADITSSGRQSDSFLFFGVGKTGPLIARLQPWGVTPGRWARVLTARLAARVTEAQYRDAVRLQTDNLYTAFVNAQASQQQVRFARATHAGFENLIKMTRHFAEAGQIGKADFDRVVAEQERAALALADAEVALLKGRLTLADLLNVTEAEADRMEVVDLPDVPPPDPPPVEGLIRLAQSHRPDLLAYRLGLLRARSECLRAWFERFPDLYVRSPSNRPEGKAPGAGVVAPRGVPVLLVRFPDAGHQGGKVVRARVNVDQSRIELARVERQVTLDVRLAHLEYRQSLDAVRGLKDKVLPSALRVREDAFRLFQGGQVDARKFLAAQKEYQDVVRQYGDAVIHHRRSTLALDTAVGARVLP